MLHSSCVRTVPPFIRVRSLDVLRDQKYYVEIVLRVHKVSRDKAISDGPPVQLVQSLQVYF